MAIFFIFVILIIIAILLYVSFYPKTNCLYKDDYDNIVKVIDINNFVVTLVYVLDDGQEVTGPQNWGLFEFVKTFGLWKML